MTDRANHQHRESTGCVCCTAGLEPNERCPVHGAGEWPPRCEECGCFMPWPKYDEEGKRL